MDDITHILHMITNKSIFINNSNIKLEQSYTWGFLKVQKYSQWNLQVDKLCERTNQSVGSGKTVVWLAHSIYRFKFLADKSLADDIYTTS